MVAAIATEVWGRGGGRLTSSAFLSAVELVVPAPSSVADMAAPATATRRWVVCGAGRATAQPTGTEFGGCERGPGLAGKEIGISRGSSAAVAIATRGGGDPTWLASTRRRDRPRVKVCGGGGGGVCATVGEQGEGEGGGEGGLRLRLGVWRIATGRSNRAARNSSSSDVMCDDGVVLCVWGGLFRVVR